MDLNLEKPGDHHYIRSLSERGICVADRFYTGSLLISATGFLDWPPASTEQLEDHHFDDIFAMNPEVVLIGTGASQVFLSPQRMMLFYSKGIGIEVMNTDAACRTFNVLVSEGREVVAALMQA
jgi:uncharacterized protein